MRTRFPDTDIVIVRENTEDLYAGIEFEEGSDEVEKLRAWPGRRARLTHARGVRHLDRLGVRLRADSRGRVPLRGGERGEKVTAAHKANIMKFSDGLFLDVARQVAERHPGIEFEDRIIDNLCNQLVSRPEEYDVVVLPNLYGDIVSDLGAGLIGALAWRPGPTSARAARSSRPPTARLPSTRARTRSTPRRSCPAC